MGVATFLIALSRYSARASLTPVYHMRKNHLAGLIATALFNCAYAENISVSVIVSDVGHEAFGNYGIDHMVGSYYGSPNWSSFQGSLTTADKLVFKLSAPQGHKFVYTPAAESIGANLFFGNTQWSAPSATFGGLSTLLPSTVTLDNYQGGQAWTNSLNVKVSADRKTVFLDGYMGWMSNQRPVSFSGFTVTVDLAKLDGAALPSYTYTPNGFGARFQDVYSVGLGDTAPALAVVAVPEPSTYLLMLCGVGGISLLRRGRRSSVVRGKQL